MSVVAKQLQTFGKMAEQGPADLLMCWHTMSKLQYLVCKNMNVVNHHPCLSDWIPYGFFLFLRMKSQPSSASSSGANSEADYFEGDSDK